MTTEQKYEKEFWSKAPDDTCAEYVRLKKERDELLAALRFCEEVMNEGGKPRLMEGWERARAILAKHGA